ncbi:MAG: efflux RND transporter periplasmic adaptor subunit [Pseudomonadota bacterium]
MPVTTATASQHEVPVQIKAIGQVEALSTVSITAQVEGQLKKVHFKEGQDVELGQQLFTIDPRPYQAALDQALANLAKDQALLKEYRQEAERNKDLVKRDFVSKQDYDQIVSKADSQAAAVKADEAAVEKARLNLSYCYIHAPLAGRTGSLLVHEGNVVNTGPDHPLVVIKETHPCYVSFAVPERELGRIHNRQVKQGPLQVQAAPPDSAEPLETGKLSFIDNQVDKSSGTILLKGAFPNPQNHLWPGQFVNVTLTLDVIPGAVVAPARAIQTGPNGLFVFVVGAGGTVEMRSVQTGEVMDTEIVVSKGLKPGERVVTDGQLALYPGAKAFEAKPAGGAQPGDAKGGEAGKAASQEKQPKTGTPEAAEAKAEGGKK